MACALVRRVAKGVQAASSFLRLLLLQGFWKNRDQINRFLKYAAQQLHVTSEEDWYRIGTAQLKALGGGGLAEMGGMFEVSSHQSSYYALK